MNPSPRLKDYFKVILKGLIVPKIFRMSVSDKMKRIVFSCNCSTLESSSSSCQCQLGTAYASISQSLYSSKKQVDKQIILMLFLKFWYLCKKYV